MTAILIFVIAVIGFNCIPLLIKTHSPKLEKVISRVLVFTTIVFVLITTMLFNDYRLKGINSNSIIGLIFITSTFSFFSLVKYSRKKMIQVILLTPLILISIFTLMFGQTIYESKVNDNYGIEVSIGGFLACGESIRITRSEYVIFEKAVFYENSLCVKGINKIETIECNKKHSEFLIYHNGEMDSENPYRYQIDSKDMW